VYAGKVIILRIFLPCICIFLQYFRTLFSFTDVVYDIIIILPLVKVLKMFLSRPHEDSRGPTVAYIASTIRNEDTRDQFLIALSK